MNAPLSLEEAQARLLAIAGRVEVERVAAPLALGRWLAEPLIAAHDSPALPTSAMDGYAVAPGDVAGPWRVTGESAAGHPFPGAIAPGEAVRIATGAVMPNGSGAVILQEDTRRDADALRLIGPAPQPEDLYVRPVASDFARGQELLKSGSRITPAALALALASGTAALPVSRPIRIALIDCGDELTADSTRPAPHTVPASNAAMLAAMLAGLPVDTGLCGPLPDQIEALVDAFETAAGADLIVTTGGASVGDHDLTRPALERWGATLDFWRVAIKPGKPLLVARRGRQIILGLPGNPVSAYVTAYLLLLPLVRAMAGAQTPLPGSETMPLGAPLPAGGARREFLRGRIEAGCAVPLARQDSAGLKALAAATILIDRPAHGPRQGAGTPVSIYRLQNGGIA